ncbi:MAG: protein kinase, partial [Polyangiaceae bacterium]|nr:protein kinase [Polyangiaceae bacterium]
DGTEEPRVLDFGLAKFLDDPSEAGLTRAGSILGTPAYMSPEQATGAPTDARADVYSLGIVLYELIAGTRPFVGAPAELLRMHLLQDLPPLRAARPTLERVDELDAVLRRATAKSVAARYADAGELGQALDPFVPDRRGRMSPSGLHPVEAPRREDFSLDATMVGARAPSKPIASLETVASVPVRSATPFPAQAAPAPQEPTVVVRSRSSEGASGPSKKALAIGAAVLAAALVVGGIVLASGDDAGSSVETPTETTPVSAADLSEDEPTEPSAAEASAITFPPEIESIRRSYPEGSRLSDDARGVLFRYSRAHAGDARAWLVMAHLDFANGARSDALRFYENALAADPASKRHPEMLRDIVIMTSHRTVGWRAEQMLK